MNSSLYAKLAFTNLKKNRRAYIPYILTTIITMMMFYIVHALAQNDGIIEMPGSETLKQLLNMAVCIVGIFGVIFLFYTNSFLMKQRKKEIGLFNVLGMGKRHIAKMMLFETFIIGGISLTGGIIGGLIFSKLMFLILLKIIHFDVTLRFRISGTAIVTTGLLFGFIFLLTLLFNLWQIKLSNPIELLRGGNTGEREPKAKKWMTLLGIVCIGIGYYISLITESPLQAVNLFFAAVLLVILGTYALFTAGSIALLKILRKNKRFYYQTKHFSAISGMIYRMKQNAVGLANICILSTAVLVMISTTVSLYAGMEDILVSRFPREFRITNYAATEESVQMIDQIVKEELSNNRLREKNLISYRAGSLVGELAEDKKSFQFEFSGSYAGVANLYQMVVIPLNDYNRIEGTELKLYQDETAVYFTDHDFAGETITIGNRVFQTVKVLDNVKLNYVENKQQSEVTPYVYIVVEDESVIQDILQIAYGNETEGSNLERMKYIQYIVDFDLEGNLEDKIAAMTEMKMKLQGSDGSVSCEGRELYREEFYGLYGGFLFIGVFLGFLFLMATVLIIYYKQISEGYEDKERYKIMQNVGMSTKEVRQSIRSQVLAVFFLPLIASVVHIAVAFKVITKLLAILNLVNVPLFLTCTVITVTVFSAIYALVFVITAREYYRVVK